jgi:hypothetical protein
MVSHKKREQIGRLLAVWREARRIHPGLFYMNPNEEMEHWRPGRVRLWTQEKATQDTIISCFLSDLNAESYEFSVVTVDCVGSEHSDTTKLRKYMNNQASHVIGPRQTAKTQVTDIRFARLGKLAGEEAKNKRRKLMRLRAHAENTHSTLVSKHLDLIYICHAMQTACINDNRENQGVLKAFRMGGWLAYKPTSGGLLPAVGRGYDKFNLGSSRLSNELMGKRFSWLDEGGVPIQPNWNDLMAVRARHTRVNARSRPIKEAANTGAELLATFDPNITSFIDFLDGYGEQPFDNQICATNVMEKVECLSIDWITASSLHDNAVFLSLHPKVRNAIMMSTAIKHIPSQKKSKRSELADKKLVDKLQKKERMTGAKTKFRDLALELGSERAKELTVPSVSKKTRCTKKKAEKTTAKRGVRLKPGNKKIQCRTASAMNKNAEKQAVRRRELNESLQRTRIVQQKMLEDVRLFAAVAPLECEAQTPLECEAQTPQPDETRQRDTLAAERMSVRIAHQAIAVRGIQLLSLAKDIENKEGELKIHSSTTSSALAKLKQQPT